jgi:Flp pilus assembly protein TadG
MHPTRPPTRSIRSAAEERGAGVVSTTAGVTVFLVLLLFAAQVLYNLYATSVVTAAAYDAARVVAGAGARGDTLQAEQQGKARFRQLLGRYGTERVETLDFSESTDDVVVLHVRSRNPNLIFGGSGRTAFGVIDRRVRVRVERFQESS